MTDLHWFEALGEPGWTPVFHGPDGHKATHDTAVRWVQRLATEGPSASRSRPAPEEAWGPVLIEGSGEPFETFEALQRALAIWIGQNDDPPFFVSVPHPAFRRDLYGRESS